MIIGKILTPEASEMAFVDRDDVVNHLTASAADPSFGDSVLPWAPHTRAQRFDTARFYKCNYLIAELSIAIEQDIAVWARQRQCVAQLLYDPIAARMCRAVEVQDSSPTVFDDKEAVECETSASGR